MSRLKNERDTIEKMIKIYCHDKHHPEDELCTDCQALLDYASMRLKYCKFGEEKPVCGSCTIHCYKEDMRAKVKEVMRYAGPKMIYKHPLAAISHLIEKHRR
ncbi:Nitrous oxide-stimulated promoter [Desulfonispora thiosulfatigenes DSM 11270]|uniref:Nitrous oxide-stimulated promoter n=1 Tax=Desulfonispora thiosulfatigenes DSM 11270 TaxID=656914 RepID=A0A1W1UL83_DESTI|nr:nitrous oxide-stimulated promoter family protein [Desulfonispora thiosulfatigenes]SMB81888.1 Nitrous oxide-stimulated promoter [Desulfonispora thiosulfatigenes DSM 11270]